MLDIAFILIGAVFLGACVLYAFACDRLCEDQPMILDYWLGAIVTVGLLVYLVFALIRPENVSDRGHSQDGTP